jgi:PTH1 family peptidyl-tRNA hydrolase
MLVDLLSHKMGKKFRKAGFEFEAAEGRLGRAGVALVKSWTYMNDSGRVIPELRRYGDLERELLVACDEIQLPLGSVRLRREGSDGGHNGLKSVIAAMGKTFPRLRMGVGGPGAAANPDYVLGRFPKGDAPVVEEMVAWAARAAEAWAVEGVEKAMTQYNRVARSDPGEEKKA